MKLIYLYHNGHSVDYFSTSKKLFKFLQTKGLKIHKHYSEFNKWLTQDWVYEINTDGSEFCTIAKLN